MEQQKQKFYKAKWFLWVWLIFFPPIGLILLWTFHKQMKNITKIILSVVFALWFVILMVGRNGANDGFKAGLEAANQSTATPQITQSITQAPEESAPLEESASLQEKSEQPREPTRTDIEDACLSFFVEVVLKSYDEIPWGVGYENGVKVDSKGLSADLKSGEVIVSYTFEEEPNEGVNLAIKFKIDDERVGVSEVLVDGVKQDIPEDAKDGVLIWPLLDINYKG